MAPPPASQRRVLVVEDERDLADMMVYNLTKGGFFASSVHDGPSAVAAITANPPDLVVLDLMLPGLSGLEVARQVRTHPRSSTVPIVMLTAKADEADQVAGLSVGADDYVTKPFSMKVLLARVAALLRRTTDSTPEPTSVEVGPITADLGAHAIHIAGVEMKLTLTEFKLLVALMQAPKRVLSRDDLIRRVMGPGIKVTARTIDVHVAALRKKLGDFGRLIRTIRGVGYQLLEQVPAHAELDTADDDTAIP
jgi:two-component system phosphate regulon response regulator PhoB